MRKKITEALESPSMKTPKAQTWVWSTEWKEKIAASEEAIRQGKVTTFESIEDMRRALGG
jgi:hypothetical protein